MAVQEENRYVGRYRIVKEIGTGATATVYHALSDYEDVALKVLHPHLATDPVICERFRREVRIVQDLDHPGIIKIYDFATWKDHVALVMEYCPNGNLQGWVAHDEDELVGVLQQIASALSEAHGHGIIHRDLKPQNLLRAQDGTIKICDFGSARIQNLIGLTTSSMFIGTPQYVPPEFIVGYPPDPRTDLYALGAILYYAVTGQPHQTDTMVSLYNLKTKRKIRAPKQFVPHLSDWLNELIIALLGPIHQRPSDAWTLLKIAELRTISPPPETKKCLYCAESMPADIPVCLSCGQHELVLEVYKKSNAQALVLKKISEDAQVLSKFHEVLRTISGKQDLSFEFLIGDERLYSKEEKKSRIKLPVKIIENLSPSDAVNLQSLFDKLGVKTRIKYQDSSYLLGSRRKSGPLIEDRKQTLSSQAEQLLQQAFSDQVNREKKRLHDLYSAVVMTGYRLIKACEPYGQYTDLLDRVRTVQEKIRELIQRVSAFEEYLVTIQHGSIYAELQRLNRQLERTTQPEEIDLIVRKKSKQMALYQKAQEIEQEHAQVMNTVLTIQGRLQTSTDQLNLISRHKQGLVEKLDIKTIIAEIEQELAGYES